MAISDILTGLTLTSTSSTSSTSSSSISIHAPDGLTLEMVLSDSTNPPFSLQDFSDYLKTTYCNENLLFYEAVMDYNSRCETYFGPPLVDCNDAVLLSDNITLFDFRWENRHVLSKREFIWFENLKSKFELILQDFILHDAPQEINIPYEVRHQLLQSYQVDQSYHPNLFSNACSAVVELLRISAFIPFATDPNRVPIQPVKKKKPFIVSKKDKLSLDPIPPMPPIPTTTTIDDVPVPTPTTSTGFLKRIIATSITKFKGSTSSSSSSSSSIPIVSETQQQLDTPPISPPAIQSWRQQMSFLPDFSSHYFIHGKPTTVPPPPLTPTIPTTHRDDDAASSSSRPNTN